MRIEAVYWLLGVGAPFPHSPEAQASSQAGGFRSTLAAATPRPVMMTAPGYWNSAPDSRPPFHPFFTAPSAKLTCGRVEGGGGLRREEG